MTNVDLIVANMSISVMQKYFSVGLFLLFVFIYFKKACLVVRIWVTVGVARAPSGKGRERAITAGELCR